MASATTENQAESRHDGSVPNGKAPFPPGAWNETARPYPDDVCLHELVEAQVVRHADAVAVVLDDRSLSYAQLNQHANRLARELRERGVGPESVVGVCLERSFELVIALFAVLKAGGAYLPVDPDYPRARIESMLSDARVSTVITEPALATRVPSAAATVLSLGADWLEAGGHPLDDVACGAGADNAAYVIFTSGSTGRPKGVVNTHRGICNRLLWMQETFRLDATDRVLQKTPFSFDVSVWEFFWPLLSGARLVLAKPGGHRDSSYLARLIQTRGITTCHFVPSMLNAFLDEPDVPRCTSLRRVISSGEALSPELQRRFFALLASELHNLYGPTEAAVDVSHWACRRDDARNVVPIGRPIANTELYVLDEARLPVPIGTPGELYIGGVQVARGYVRRPELTAERFVPDPFSGRPDARLYKTGDLARYLEDGTIEYLGRLDFQVKVRGFRIELGEIESALSTHPAVKQAVVIAEPGTGQRLVGYVVANTRELPNVGGSGERVEQWQTIFDQTYTQPLESGDDSFDTAGWKSSYTKDPIPAEQMREWVDSTVERILALRPDRVLEIGCGTGMLLLRIAPECDRYVGTDLSRVGLDGLSQRVARRKLDRVELVFGAADQLPAGSREFDTVVLNSVAQLFPDVEYLVGVLDAAVEQVADGGRIFVGDVRNLDLLEAFHTSVELYRALGATTRAQLLQRIKSRVLQEDELVLAPSFFRLFAAHSRRVHAVELLLKRGKHQNELTRFRYDAILHVGDGVPSPAESSIDWVGLDATRQRLSNHRIRQRLTNVPNARLAPEARALAWLTRGGPATCGEFLASFQAAEGAVEPEALVDLGRELDYAACLSLPESGRTDVFDVVFEPLPNASAKAGGKPLAHGPIRLGEQSLAAPDWSSHATAPLLGTRFRALGPELRAYLSERLPEYMVPTSLTVLERLPVTANGKLDRAALPPPEASQDERSYVEPRSVAERTLADVFARVLGVSRVGIRDNFYDLGGDSILALQIVSRAHRAGVSLKPAQLFEKQTIEALARVAGFSVGASAPQGLVDGEHTLTAMQHWVLEKSPREPAYSNQVTLLQARRRLRSDWVRQALAQVIEHHDALRLRFVAADGRVSAHYVRADSEVPLWVESLEDSDQRGAETALERIACRAHQSLDLERGPLLRAVLIERGTTRPQLLLLSIHQLLVDGVSLRILLEDLSRAYDQLAQGRQPSLPPKTTSFQRAAALLAEFSASGTLLDESAHWLGDEFRRKPSVPLARPDTENRVATARDFVESLSVEATSKLFESAPRQQASSPGDILLSAFALVMARSTGDRRVLVDTEGHGRDAQPLAEADLSRTVGTFSALYPVALQIAPDTEPKELFQRIRSQLARTPARGVGYGLLRYVRGDAKLEQRLEDLPQAPFLFNYLGKFDAALSESSLFDLRFEPVGPNRNPEESRTHLLELNVAVVDGRLRMAWTYSSELYDEPTMQALAREYCEVLDAMLDAVPRSRRLTPHDFPLAELTSAELDRLVQESPPLDDIYPLLPLQAGMLFHTQLAPESPVYFVQMSANLPGDWDHEAFRRAWQAVARRQAILRTRFVTQGVPTPLQVVERDVQIPFATLDLRELDEAARKAELGRALEDRRWGYTLDRAPLMSVRLLRLSSQVTRFVWNFHHLLLDGWSMMELVEEVFAEYTAKRRGVAYLPKERASYRTLIEWYRSRDTAKATAFWKEYLAGFGSPTPLPGARHSLSRDGSISPGSEAPALAKVCFELAEPSTARLRDLARRGRFTLSTLIEGTWGLLLGSHSDRNDVVFGVVVAGRPADLRDVESIVGCCINTVPVRAQWNEANRVGAWFKRHHDDQLALRDHEHTPLVVAQRQSEVAGGVALFETVISVQGYLREHASLTAWARSLGMEEFAFVDWNSLPLSVAVDAGPKISVQIKYDETRLSSATAQSLAHDFKTWLELLPDDSEATLGTVAKRVELARSERARHTESALKHKAARKLGAMRRRPVRGEPEVK